MSKKIWILIISLTMVFWLSSFTMTPLTDSGTITENSDVPFDHAAPFSKPYDDNPQDAAYLYNSGNKTVAWQLWDDIAGGKWRILENSTPITGWTGWVNGTIVNQTFSTARPVGTYNFTIQYNDSDNVMEYDDIMVDIYDNIIPWCDDEGALVFDVNRIGVIHVWLHDNYAPGYYRILRNTTFIERDWTNWPDFYHPTDWNSSVADIVANTSQIATWYYNYEYNDSSGNFGEINIPVYISDNFAPWGSSPADAQYNYGDFANITWSLYDNWIEGYYRVLRNNNLYQDWQSWANNTPLVVSVDTSVAGNWQYEIQFNDSYGNTGSDSVNVNVSATTPTSTSPADISVDIDSAGIYVGWILTDATGGGYYRILKNGSVYVDWAAWTSGTNLSISVDTSAAGTWTYTIEYNNTAGVMGTSDTISVTITEPSSDGGVPGFEYLFIIFGLLTLIIPYLRKTRSKKIVVK